MDERRKNKKPLASLILVSEANGRPSSFRLCTEFYLDMTNEMWDKENILSIPLRGINYNVWEISCASRSPLE
jgi:hypothetical protein